MKHDILGFRLLDHLLLANFVHGLVGQSYLRKPRDELTDLRKYICDTTPKIHILIPDVKNPEDVRDLTSQPLRPEEECICTISRNCADVQHVLLNTETRQAWTIAKHIALIL